MSKKNTPVHNAAEGKMWLKLFTTRRVQTWAKRQSPRQDPDDRLHGPGPGFELQSL